MKTKHVQYETHGTCSKMIDVTADENNVIQQVFFLGGCNGNLQGVSQLVRGQQIDDVIKKLDGIRCGTKGTSCPDSAGARTAARRCDQETRRYPLRHKGHFLS